MAQFNVDITDALAELYRVKAAVTRVPMKLLSEQALSAYMKIMDARLEDPDAYSELVDGLPEFSRIEALIEKHRRLEHFHAMYLEIVNAQGDALRLASDRVVGIEQEVSHSADGPTAA